jgi:hypothetical protein
MGTEIARNEIGNGGGGGRGSLAPGPEPTRQMESDNLTRAPIGWRFSDMASIRPSRRGSPEALSRGARFAHRTMGDGQIWIAISSCWVDELLGLAVGWVGGEKGRRPDCVTRQGLAFQTRRVKGGPVGVLTRGSAASRGKGLGKQQG